MQLPRADWRGDDVITTLNNRARNVRDLIGIAQQLPIFFHETAIDEVMGFDAREREGVIISCKGIGALRRWHHGHRRAFPPAPCASAVQPDIRVITKQSLVISGQHVSALGFGDWGDKLLPKLGMKA